jgi:hypothetical protein
VIRVEITARHRRVLMAGDALEKVQLNASVGHPGQGSVSQAVPHEASQPKIINQLVPPRRIAQGRGRDHPSTRTNQQTSIPGPAHRKSLQRRAQRLDDWHRTPPPVLGLLGYQAAAACLPPRDQQPTKEVDATHLQSGHLTNPQRRRCQDHHAITPCLMTTRLHGFLDQPAQRAHVWQGEIAGTLLSLYQRGGATDDTPPSSILCRNPCLHGADRLAALGYLKMGTLREAIRRTDRPQKHSIADDSAASMILAAMGE